ncbi:MAG: carboxylating nicotinate-nucleotide diphosphorylase [Candidatus Gracilibacteria bacterium]|jgi:nicotinate-nucleotide pyrophosphorylase (carboxylating)
MDRKSLKLYTHKSESFLSVRNNTYKQWIFRYTFLELEKDLGNFGDITTRTFIDEKILAKAQIIAKSDGILAGLDEIKYFLVDADVNFRPKVSGKFIVDTKFKDGDVLKKGDIVMEISARAVDILAVERTVLNLLMRMSAVATKTMKIVEKVKNFDVLIVPTRKTLWGMLDKKAVFIGGGGTHRLSLSDCYLIKDNHLKLINYNFDFIYNKIKEKQFESRFIEIEVESLENAVKAAKMFKKALADGILNSIPVIMFDNMSPESVEMILEELKSQNLYEDVLFECSGGISEENVVEYAKTGIDIISMGEITADSGKFDMGLEV